VSSPLPWSIRGGWEQMDPGVWITDAAGKVIFAEGDPWIPDVPLSVENRALLKRIIWLDKEPNTDD